MVIIINHTVSYSGLGLLHAHDALAVRPGSASKKLNEIENGKALLVQIGQQSMYFSLEKSDKAINFIRKCFERGVLDES